VTKVEHLSYADWVDAVKESDAPDCKECEGEGTVPCEECGGSGWEECWECGSDHDCEECFGFGTDECHECDGHGKKGASLEEYLRVREREQAALDALKGHNANHEHEKGDE